MAAIDNGIIPAFFGSRLTAIRNMGRVTIRGEVLLRYFVVIRCSIRAFTCGGNKQTEENDN